MFRKFEAPGFDTGSWKQNLGAPLIKERTCAPTCGFTVVTKVGHLRYNLGRPVESLQTKTTGTQTVDIEVVLHMWYSKVIGCTDI